MEPGFTVAKTASEATGDAGDPITYTITVTNVSNTNGADAFDVHLSDIVPTGMAYVADLSGPELGSRRGPLRRRRPNA